MSRTLPTSAATQAAGTQAAAIEIALLHELSDLTVASQLFDELWGNGPGDSYLSPSLLRALEHAGNYAAGAYVGVEMVGAVMGFLGQDEHGTYLHSHILGVSERSRGASIGFALKQHQRDWALARGIDRITWTFDPLVRRNAFFNLQKLGAGAASYLVNFYGQMDDDINGVDESDRLLVEWRLSDPRAVHAARERLPSPDVDTSVTAAFSVDGKVSMDGWGDRIVCATPVDIVVTRRSDPDEAMRWRRGLRDTLGAAMSDGYVVTGFTRSGWYVLDRA